MKNIIKMRQIFMILSLLFCWQNSWASYFSQSPPAWADVGQSITFKVKQDSGNISNSRTELQWWATGSCANAGKTDGGCAAAWSTLEYTGTVSASSLSACTIVHQGKTTGACGGAWAGGSAIVNMRTYTISGGLANSLESRSSTYPVTAIQNSGQDSNGVGTNVIYTSETPTICSVTSAGLVKNLNDGTCTIRATLVDRYNNIAQASWYIAPDTDSDGVTDASDNCPFLSNATQTNTDSAKGNSTGFSYNLGNACNDLLDKDGDEWEDTKDNCPVNANATQSDTSNANGAVAGDGVGDACDGDADADGKKNNLDNCPTVSNASQADSNGVLDGDGVGDACESDTDGDGKDNILDNCPTVSNSNQLDIDHDGKGDACEEDQDHDGILTDNGAEKDNCPFTPNADQQDIDADGQGDVCEVAYVTTTGNDTNNCTTWLTACATISQALQVAANNLYTQVYIAKGTYYPAATIALKKGISLYGGFNGSINEVRSSDANPTVNLTIISGDTDKDNPNQDINGMVWSAADLNPADLNSPDLATLLSASVASTLEADNITLYGLILNAANGSANGGALIVNNSRVELIATRIIANMAGNGGGIYMSGAAVVNITSSEFKANKAASAATNHGGAIYNTVSSPGEVNIVNSLFTGNSATGVGGAIYKPNTATMNLNNVRLEKNSSASWGGAIAHARGILNITNGSVFDSNTAVSLGGAIRVVAGTTLSAILNVDTTEFNNNYSDSRGGAIDFTSTTSANEAHKIYNNLFLLNRSKVSGGAIDVSITISTGSIIDLINNTFYQNYAGTKVDGTASGSIGHGGAINIYTGNLGLVNANFNTMVANQSKYSAGLGGAIYVDSANKLTLSRSLIAGNLASNGANVYLNAAATDGGYNLLGFNAISGVAGSSTLANVTNIIPTAAQAPTLDKIVESMVSFDGGDGYYAKLRTLPVAGGSSGFARDAIPAGSCGTVVTDTRGEKRPDAKASKCDIGAYEFTVLTCQQDAQRRYNQGEVFVKVCSPQTENMELALGNIGYMGLMLLILMFSYRERQTLIKQA